jgi:hypothetical protein
MQELISKLTEKAGISADQAQKAIETIKEFAKDKFPMMAGAVDNLFASSPANTTAGSTSAAPSSNIMDKISDVIPGEAGEKVEEFAKNAAHKAEDLFEGAKEKLSGLFGTKK